VAFARFKPQEESPSDQELTLVKKGDPAVSGGLPWELKFCNIDWMECANLSGYLSEKGLVVKNGEYEYSDPQLAQGYPESLSGHFTMTADERVGMRMTSDVSAVQGEEVLPTDDRRLLITEACLTPLPLAIASEGAVSVTVFQQVQMFYPW
jgi:hypothetical protein